jgi:hypothetical protein
LIKINKLIHVLKAYSSGQCYCGEEPFGRYDLRGDL